MHGQLTLAFFYDCFDSDAPLHQFAGVAGEGDRARPEQVLDVCQRRMAWHHDESRHPPALAPVSLTTWLLLTLHEEWVATSQRKHHTTTQIVRTLAILHRLPSVPPKESKTDLIREYFRRCFSKSQH